MSDWTGWHTATKIRQHGRGRAKRLVWAYRGFEIEFLGKHKGWHLRGKIATRFNGHRVVPFEAVRPTLKRCREAIDARL